MMGFYSVISSKWVKKNKNIYCSWNTGGDDGGVEAAAAAFTPSIKIM